MTFVTTGTLAPNKNVQVELSGGPAPVAVQIDHAVVEGGDGTLLRITFDPMWTPPHVGDNTDVRVRFLKGGSQARSDMTDGGKFTGKPDFDTPWDLLSTSAIADYDAVHITVTIV